MQALRCIQAHGAVVHARTEVYNGTVVDAATVGTRSFVVYASVVHRCAAAE